MKKFIAVLFILSLSFSNICYSQCGWVLTYPYPTGNNLYSIALIDSNNAITVGRYGTILKTTNGGNSWIKQLDCSKDTLNAVQFMNQYTGYIAGTEGSSPVKGIIYKTTNRGINWVRIIASENYDIKSIYFLDPNTGYAGGVGYSGSILKTTNGGINWSLISTSTGISIISLYFANNNTGYITGNPSDTIKIYKTTNGGANWIELPRPITPELHDIEFLTPDEGFICGFGGAILKTSIGGIIVGSNIESNQFPTSFSLSQNYPNPFNPVTKIKYDVPSNVKIIVYDILGREIETLVNETKKPGSYEVTWDGSRYASGVYFYRLITDEFIETKKMVLIK